MYIKVDGQRKENQSSQKHEKVIQRFMFGELFPTIQKVNITSLIGISQLIYMFKYYLDVF
jgi:hypothetical protein